MPELDIDNAASEIASDLGFGSAEPEAEIVEEAAPEPEVQAEEQVQEFVDPYKDPPKSWKKEWHEKWNAVPGDVREIFYNREKQMLDGLESYKQHSEIGKKLSPVFDQHREFLRSQGVDEVQAVNYLLSAQYRLMNGTPDQKREMLLNLAKNVGIDFNGQPTGEQPANNEITRIAEQVKSLQSVMQQQAAAQAQQVRAKVSEEVSQFAANHEFFDDVADEVAKFIQAGYELSTAYEMATWANPVVREKQLQKETTSRLQAEKAKAKAEAEAALKARSTNVRNKASNKAPTEPLGSWDDTMKATLASIKAGAL